VLQINEANRSVLEDYGGIEQPRVLCGAVVGQRQGARVVYGQRILQASSDVFLGTARNEGRDYYLRQFHDMKGALDITGMSPSAFSEYVSVCALCWHGSRTKRERLDVARIRRKQRDGAPGSHRLVLRLRR